MGGFGEATGAEQKDVGHADLLLGCIFAVILTGASIPPPPFPIIVLDNQSGCWKCFSKPVQDTLRVFVHPHEWKLGWFHVFGDVSWLWDAWAARGLEPQRGERWFFAS